MKRKRLSQAARSLILICVFLIAVNFTLSFVLIRDSSHAIREQIESRMLDVANTAAAMLDGDVLRTLEAEDVGTPEYQAAHKILFCFEENIDLAYIYCVRELEDGSFVFMIDPDPDEPGAFGEHIPYTEALHNASLGIPGVDKEPYVDQWGRFYSSYSPVFDSEGKVSGIVAVDFTAAWYDQQIFHQLKATVAICGLSLLIAAVIIVLIVHRFRKRFNHLFREMNLVSEEIETLVREVSPGAKPIKWKEETESGMDDIDRLGSRISGLQDELSKQISWVRSQTYIDGLTGLGNRLAYEEHVHHLKHDIYYNSASFAVAVFDLNGLKEINDTYGHERGDEAIRYVATILKETFPDGKQYRIGGDEFIVVFDEDYDDLPNRLEAMRGKEGEYSASMGYAIFDPKLDTEYSMVFSRADMAMYNDKREYYRTHSDRRRH